MGALVFFVEVSKGSDLLKKKNRRPIAYGGIRIFSQPIPEREDHDPWVLEEGFQEVACGFQPRGQVGSNRDWLTGFQSGEERYGTSTPGRSACAHN